MPSCWQILACTYWKRKKAKHFFLAQLSCGGVSFQEWLSSLAWNCSFAALHLFLAFQGMQVIYFGLPRLILEVFVLFPSQRTMAPSRLPHAIRGRAGAAGLSGVAMLLLPQRGCTQPWYSCTQRVPCAGGRKTSYEPLLLRSEIFRNWAWISVLSCLIKVRSYHLRGAGILSHTVSGS